MKFLIRADASIQIGSGHMMRCLTLAHALKKQGHSVQFITRAHAGHLADFVHQQGFEYVLLPERVELSGSVRQASVNLKIENEPQFPHSAWLGCTQAQDFADCEPHIRAFAPDWIICDHYALSEIWENSVKQILSCKIMVIDDLHDRQHAADLLLDQNLGHSAQNYANLLPAHCRVLAGTRYALLREEFSQWRETALNRRNNHSGSLQNILINLGGVDKDNLTLTLLQRLQGCLKDESVTVVMGKTAPHIANVQAFAENAPFSCQVIVNAQNMAELMAEADWAIGAAGSTSWERCALGLPTLLLVIADNQREIAEQLQAAGAALSLNTQEIYTEKFTQAIQFLASLKLMVFRQPPSSGDKPENLIQMSENAAKICDGLGVNRVLNYLLQNDFSGSVRLATMDDCERVFHWRNHADIRRFMFNTDELIWANHAAWFAKQMNNPDFKILIYCENQQEKGYISFKRQPENANVWEWGFYTAPESERGTGTRMARLALSWAFNELGAHEILGQVLPHNAASLRLHEKMGFCRQPENNQHIEFKLLAETFLY